MITLRFVVDEQTFLTLFYTKNQQKNNVTIDLYMVIRTCVQQFCALATFPFKIDIPTKCLLCGFVLGLVCFSILFAKIVCIDFE